MSSNGKEKPTGLTGRVRSSVSKARAYYQTRFQPDTTFVTGVLAAITSFLTLALILTVTVWNAVILFTTDSPSFFRAIFQCFEGVFAAGMLSIYFDRTRYELFDFWTAMVFFLLKLPFTAYALILEISRVTSCPGGGTSSIYFTICSVYPSESDVLLWFTIAIFTLSLINFILLIVWYFQFDKLRIAAASGVLNRDPLLQQRDVTNRDEAASSRIAAKLIGQNMRNSNLGIAIIAVVVLVVILFTLVVAMFSVAGDWAASFYRGGFLTLPATYAGAEIAFFMTTPYSWSIFCLVLGALSLVSLTLGLVKEIPRFFHCALGTAAPTTFENDICANEGWRAFLLPSVMTSVAILLLVSFVLMIVRVSRSKSEVVKD